MATDYIIGALIVVSAAVNALALGAFWISPGLRTTANRFVINLLIANLAGCLVLCPVMINVNPTTFTGGVATYYAGVASAMNVSSSPTTGNNSTAPQVEQDIVADNNNNCANESVVKDAKWNFSCGGGGEQQLFKDDAIPLLLQQALYGANVNMWNFDLTAALGALSVLLIVGDTWCAITDPLHYHNRVSDCKAWILIGAAWFISILVGIGSVFKQSTAPSLVGAALIGDGGGGVVVNLLPVYNAAYSILYFMCIILFPICAVCGMYWKIFSEAKQNGVRMRQNGSSPLLQSALNLATASAVAAANASMTTTKATTTTTASAPNPTDGLTMNIDKKFITRDSHQYLEVPTDLHAPKVLVAAAAAAVQTKDKSHHHQTMFSFAKDRAARLTRNCSARHLLDLDTRSSLRSVRSTPNLQKSSGNSPTAETPAAHINCPPKALGYMTSIRHRLSNASSIFKYREESRAARISILIVIMCLVSYLPYGILVLADGRGLMTRNQCKLLAAIFVSIASVSSPFLFAYRNKRVRRGILRLFGVDAKTNERLQKREMSSLLLRRNQSTLQLQKRAASTLSINSTNKYTASHPHQPASDRSSDQSRYSIMADVSVDDDGKKDSVWKRFCTIMRKLGCGNNSTATSSSTDEQVADV